MMGKEFYNGRVYLTGQDLVDALLEADEKGRKRDLVVWLVLTGGLFVLALVALAWTALLSGE